MIERLLLRDFQAHTKLKIELDPHVTTIIGASDQGKSAVLRALRWLATNRPGGEAFVKHGRQLAKVALKLDDREIRRTKGKGKNTYHLDGHPLKAFGADVPDEVLRLLNLGDANFQGQHDTPFWFSDSAGVVSRSLNQIINLGVIDDTLAKLASMQRDANSAVSSSAAQLAEAKATWVGLKPAKAMNRKLQAVEELAAKATAARARTTLLEQTVRKAQTHEQTLENARQGWAEAANAATVGAAWLEVSQQRDMLAALITEADRYTSRANTAIPNLDAIVALASRAGALAKQRDALARLLAEAQRLTTARDVATDSAATLHKQLDTQLGERCPLCGISRTTR